MIQADKLDADALVSATTTVVSLPEIYLRVKQTIEDPDAGLSDLASVLSRDPGMTARLLKIANSAFFGLMTKVETPLHAVNLLGPQQVHDLVLATSVSRAFSGICDSVMNMDIFWQNSIYCAALCKLLGEECNLLSSERFFIIGLLYDIGHLVMYHGAAESSQAALTKAQQETLALHIAEDEVLGFNYAEVGGKLLAAWGLPESICMPVLFQVYPEDTEEFRQDAAITNIAASIVHSANPDVALANRELDIDPEIWQVVGISEIQCRQVLKIADKSANEVLGTIFPGQSEVA